MAAKLEAHVKDNVFVCSFRLIQAWKYSTSFAHSNVNTEELISEFYPQAPDPNLEVYTEFYIMEPTEYIYRILSV